MAQSIGSPQSQYSHLDNKQEENPVAVTTDATKRPALHPLALSYLLAREILLYASFERVHIVEAVRQR